MSPILIGLLLSVPLTMLTSLTSAGLWTRKHGLLLTPEETDPPPELSALEHLMARAESWATPPGGPNDSQGNLSGQSNTHPGDAACAERPGAGTAVDGGQCVGVPASARCADDISIGWRVRRRRRAS